MADTKVYEVFFTGRRANAIGNFSLMHVSFKATDIEDFKRQFWQYYELGTVTSSVRAFRFEVYVEGKPLEGNLFLTIPNKLELV